MIDWMFGEAIRVRPPCDLLVGEKVKPLDVSRQIWCRCLAPLHPSMPEKQHSSNIDPVEDYSSSLTFSLSFPAATSSSNHPLLDFTGASPGLRLPTSLPAHLAPVSVSILLALQKSHHCKISLIAIRDN